MIILKLPKLVLQINFLKLVVLLRFGLLKLRLI
nr:MAG TPA: hypothetical protein [Crassvirales sp.]